MDRLLRVNKVEKIGSGIKRIRRAMRGYGLKVRFDVSEGWFSVVFPRSTQKTITKGSENVLENVPEKKLSRIGKLIAENNKITIPELARRLDVNEKTVKRDIARLKKSGKARRVGPDKGGHWEILG